jgi:hypothetical protein
MNLNNNINTLNIHFPSKKSLYDTLHEKEECLLSDDFDFEEKSNKDTTMMRRIGNDQIVLYDTENLLKWLDHCIADNKLFIDPYTRESLEYTKQRLFRKKNIFLLYPELKEIIVNLQFLDDLWKQALNSLASLQQVHYNLELVYNDDWYKKAELYIDFATLVRNGYVFNYQPLEAKGMLENNTRYKNNDLNFDVESSNIVYRRKAWMFRTSSVTGGNHMPNAQIFSVSRFSPSKSSVIHTRFIYVYGVGYFLIDQKTPIYTFQSMSNHHNSKKPTFISFIELFLYFCSMENLYVWDLMKKSFL